MITTVDEVASRRSRFPPVAYDLLTRRAVHPASIAGIGFSFVSFAVMLVIVSSPLMGSIEAWLFS